MGILIFKHGVMGSAKTAQALITLYNCQERGLKVKLLKPTLDTRDGKTKVKSRIVGLEAEGESVASFIESNTEYYDVIIVDESQFMTKEQVDYFSGMVDYEMIKEVICFGLRSDFQNQLFKGSARLLCVADKIEEIPSKCWCGRRASINARIIEGKIVYEGPQIALGKNELYTPLCRKHYYEGKIKKESD